LSFLRRYISIGTEIIYQRTCCLVFLIHLWYVSAIIESRLGTIIIESFQFRPEILVFDHNILKDCFQGIRCFLSFTLADSFLSKFLQKAAHTEEFIVSLITLRYILKLPLLINIGIWKCAIMLMSLKLVIIVWRTVSI
jgi:hypothetical protein